MPRGAGVVGHRSHGAPSGDAPRERTLLELENAFMDAEGVRHDDRVRDALPVVLAERARILVVLRAVARRVPYIPR